MSNASVNADQKQIMEFGSNKLDTWGFIEPEELGQHVDTSRHPIILPGWFIDETICLMSNAIGGDH